MLNKLLGLAVVALSLGACAAPETLEDAEDEPIGASEDALGSCSVTSVGAPTRLSTYSLLATARISCPSSIGTFTVELLAREEGTTAYYLESQTVISTTSSTFNLSRSMPLYSTGAYTSPTGWGLRYYRVRIRSSRFSALSPLSRYHRGGG